MKVFLDTSVLIAAFWGDHPNHAPSLKLLASIHRKQGSCAAHTLGEVYAVMTRLPVKPLIPPEQALLFINDILERLTVVGLDVRECAAAIHRAAVRGITGGKIYDALILASAIKTKADAIFTWNADHFRQIYPEAADRFARLFRSAGRRLAVVCPADPECRRSNAGCR